jgi:thioredoxin-like negative regulator of GroEL
MIPLEWHKLKKLWVWAGLFLATAGSSHASPFKGTEIKWSGNYGSALALAKNTHRLLMVDFWATWCSGCKLLDKNTYRAASVIEGSQAFVPVKLNAEKDGMAQVARYDIKVFPTVLFLRPDGELVWKVEGYMPASQFLKQMQSAHEIGADLPKYEALYKSRGSSPELDMKLVRIYAGTGKLAQIHKILTALDANPPSEVSSYAGGAYNAGGDAFQFAQKLPIALHYYRMAEETGKPADIAYARFNIATCCLADGDVDSARPVLEALVAMGHEADNYRKQAASLLKDMGAKKHA